MYRTVTELLAINANAHDFAYLGASLQSSVHRPTLSPAPESQRDKITARSCGRASRRTSATTENGPPSRPAGGSICAAAHGGSAKAQSNLKTALPTMASPAWASPHPVAESCTEPSPPEASVLASEASALVFATSDLASATSAA